jgi:hypothetical protein
MINKILDCIYDFQIEIFVVCAMATTFAIITAVTYYICKH